MPLSTGGERSPDAPVKPAVEMSVVVVRLDGEKCRGRRVSTSAVGDSNIGLPNTSYLLREIFSVTLASGGDHLAILPAFYFEFPRHEVQMFFSGVELATEDAACVKDVRLVKEYRPGDVLFDFFIPADPERIAADDLFQRVYVPGAGFI